MEAHTDCTGRKSNQATEALDKLLQSEKEKKQASISTCLNVLKLRSRRETCETGISI